MNTRNIRHRTSALAIIAALAVGASGCTTLSTVTSGGTVTPAMVEADAVAACGFLPSAETASSLIQAATQTAGSATAVTDADYTALAEQLAKLACTVAGATAVSTAPVATTTATTTAKSLRRVRRRLVAPGTALVGNIQVPIVGQFVK